MGNSGAKTTPDTLSRPRRKICFLPLSDTDLRRCKVLAKAKSTVELVTSRMMPFTKEVDVIKSVLSMEVGRYDSVA